MYMTKATVLKTVAFVLVIKRNREFRLSLSYAKNPEKKANILWKKADIAAKIPPEL